MSGTIPLKHCIFIIKVILKIKIHPELFLKYLDPKLQSGDTPLQIYEEVNVVFFSICKCINLQQRTG